VDGGEDHARRRSGRAAPDRRFQRPAGRLDRWAASTDGGRSVPIVGFGLTRLRLLQDGRSSAAVPCAGRRPWFELTERLRCHGLPYDVVPERSRAWRRTASGPW